MQDLFTTPSFKEALARFASSVTVVLTEDAEVGPVGFTATSFCSVSLEPPLVLVCLTKTAECFTAFEAAHAFTVSFLAADQADVAMRFATRGASKFDGMQELRGEATGLPLIPDASVHLECSTFARYDGGDHIILIGRVARADARDAEPMVYLNRQFGTFRNER